MNKGVAPGLAETVPSAWRSIAEQQKTILGWPQWSKGPRLQPGARVKNSRLEFRSLAGETTEAVAQLADANGIGLEGARLRLKAWAFRMKQDVTATLEVQGGHSFVTIARLDAWPRDPHLNSLRVLKHHALKHLPGQIDICHVHRFEDNAHFGREAFAPKGNLPVARPLSDRLGSFRDFLRYVALELRIDGADSLDAPDWQEML